MKLLPNLSCKMLYAKVASFHGEIVFLPLPVNAYRSGAPPLPPTPPRPLPGEALSGWVEEVGASLLLYILENTLRQKKI